MMAALRVAVAWATVLAFTWFGKDWLGDLSQPLFAGGLFAWLLGIGSLVGFAVWIASNSVRSKKGHKA